MTTRAWVLGARGLLGSAVVRELRGRQDWVEFEAPQLPWGSPDDVVAAVVVGAARLIAEAEANGEHWAVLYTAGSGATSSPKELFDAELAVAARAFEAVGQASAGHSRGALFVASSAGGVYGGSANPPFDERTTPRPLGAYGQFKLELEAAATDVGERWALPVLIGRITNLYGPGQRLDKMQGLISHLALAHFNRRPVHIYVPLETTRDYLFVDDCASLVLDGLDRLRVASEEAPATVVKILGSGQEVNISSLIGYMRAIGKAPGRIVLGASSKSAQQAVDLRMRSTVWTDLDRREKMPVAAGIHATTLSILKTLQG